MIVFCNEYSATPLDSVTVTDTIRDEIGKQLAARCYCTAASSITSLTVAEDYVTGRQLHLELLFSFLYLVIYEYSVGNDNEK